MLFGHLSVFSVSPAGHLPMIGHRGRVGGEEQLKQGKGVRALLFVVSHRAPVSWNEQMVDLAGTWVAHAHPQEGNPPPPALSLNTSISLIPHFYPTHSSALISTSCPHLSACRKDSNMGVGSRDEGKAYN